jgi:hypothetical protein
MAICKLERYSALFIPLIVDVHLLQIWIYCSEAIGTAGPEIVSSFFAKYLTC